MRCSNPEVSDGAPEPTREDLLDQQAEEMSAAERRRQDELAELGMQDVPPAAPSVALVVPCEANDFLRDRTQNVTPSDVERLRAHYGRKGRVGLYMKDGSDRMYTLKVGKTAKLLRQFGRGWRPATCHLVAVVDLEAGTVHGPEAATPEPATEPEPAPAATAGRHLALVA